MLSGLFPFLRSAVWSVGLALCFETIALAQAVAQQRAVDPAKNGVWFQVKALVKPVPQPKGDDAKSEPRASLTVQLRISAHADGSRYFGHPSQTFDFKLSEGSEEKLFWQDSACHPRRGLPKISIVGIDGQMEQGGKRVEVTARPRKLGTRLPPDEISAGSGLTRTTIEGRPAITFQAGTSVSKLTAQVIIYTVDCAL